MLGLLAVYFAGARLFGRPAAAAAALLLALNVIEVWFARYPNAEVVMQALLFAALLAMARAQVDGDPFFAPVAGSLLGLLLFLRFDAVLGIAGVVGAVGARLVAGQRRAVVASSPTLAVGSALAARLPARPDARVRRPADRVRVAPAAGGRRGARRRGAGRRSPRSVVGAARSGAACGGRAAARRSLLAVVVWRWRSTRSTSASRRQADRLRRLRAAHLRLPLLHAAGAARRAVRLRAGRAPAFWRDPALFLTVAIFGLFFFYKIRIVPEHFWMARRFLPVILPGALLLRVRPPRSAGMRGRSAARAAAARRDRRASFLALLAVQYCARVAAGRCGHVEYAGIIPRLEQLAAHVRDDDLVIVESRDASDIHVLALPLAYIYARNVLLLPRRRPDKAMFARVPRLGARRVTGACCSSAAAARTCCRHAGRRSRWRASASRCPSTSRRTIAYPRASRQKEFDYSVYEFVPPSANLAPGALDLDVGASDDLNVAALPRQGDRATGTRSAGRATVSYHVARRRCRPAHGVTIWMDDGGRPAARAAGRGDRRAAVRSQPPTLNRDLDRARRRRLQAIHVRRFRRRWRPTRRPPASPCG